MSLWQHEDAYQMETRTFSIYWYNITFCYLLTQWSSWPVCNPWSPQVRYRLTKQGEQASRATGAKIIRPFLYSKACSALTVLPLTQAHIITPWPDELVLCQLWAPCKSVFSSPYVWHMASLFPVLFLETFLVTELLLMDKSKKNVYSWKLFFLNSNAEIR